MKRMDPLRYVFLVEADLQNHSLGGIGIGGSGSGGGGSGTGGIGIGGSGIGGSGIGGSGTGGSTSTSIGTSTTSSAGIRTLQQRQIMGHERLPLCVRHLHVCLDLIPIR